MSTFGQRLLLFLVILSGISMLCLKATRGAEDQRAVEAITRHAYSDRTRETCSFPFGKDQISLPGNAALEGGGFLQASAFLMLRTAAIVIRGVP